MNLQPTTQPILGSEALGLFARTSVRFAGCTDAQAICGHAERLAALSGSDLVLVYEAGADPGSLHLLAQWGLPPETLGRFEVLGTERFEGAGGLRALPGHTGPLPYEPLTDDLLALGVRAYWACPLWSEGELAGQLFFGSRRWDRFHDDTLAVFEATTLQIGQVLQRRRAAGEPGEPTWRESGGATPEGKRRQFIAVLAHELRNPIAPIRSGLDLLSTDLLDAEGRRTTLGMMQRQVTHLVRLIDDLLDTVRLDTGRLQVKREPVLLGDVIRSAIESIRPALAAKAQALRLEAEAAEVLVDVDPVRLSQAFVNILSANVKLTPEGGLISVVVDRDDGVLTITFEDQADAADTEAADNVFELFPNSAARNSDEGWGIGLALVRGLVELNDGRVAMARRAAGGGSVYTVTIPCADPSIRAPLPDAAGAAAPNWPSHRVLVVDDNRDAADTLGLLFELDGHTVRLAHDGPSAVSEAAEFQPEIILMDLGLPGFNGDEAARRIRAQPSSVRPFIIALTGWGADADRETTRLAGCDLHLVKPVSHDELRETMLRLTGDAGQGGRDV